MCILFVRVTRGIVGYKNLIMTFTNVLKIVENKINDLLKCILGKIIIMTNVFSELFSDYVTKSFLGVLIKC